MATKLSKIVADFRTSLATKIAVGGTTATLQSATDDDGVSLPAGQYFFTLDGDSSQKEHIVCTLSGTSLSSIKSITRQGVQSSGAVREHRIGSSVTITNFAHIKYINDLLDGTTNLNASLPLEYDATASITTANQLATKDYVDGVAIAGGADASTTVKGISKLSTAPASATDPIAVGTNDTRIPTQDENNALVGTSGTPSTSNKYVTNDDTATTGASKVVRSKSDSKIDDSLVALTTAGDIVYSDGTDLQKLAIGTAGQVLKVNSGATAPTWSSATKIDVSTTDATIGASTTETTVYSATVPAGTLGTNNGVHLKMYVGTGGGGNANQFLIIRLKYGGSTVVTYTSGVGTSIGINGYIDFLLLGAGTTSAQEGSLSTYASVASGSGYFAKVNALGTSAVDSTSDQTLSVTAKWDTTTGIANPSWTTSHATLSII